MAKTFVDTSAFYALVDEDDRHHREAVSILADMLQTDQVVTSDHVIVESWMLIASRLGRTAAMRFWDGLTGTAFEPLGLDSAFTVIGVAVADMQRAREIANEWPDQAFTIVDCTSFALIERLGIRRALAFDRQFRVFRFGHRRRHALEILPG